MGTRVKFGRTRNAVETRAFCFTTLCDWLKKTLATYSTNQMQNKNQSRLGRTRFPALGTGHVYLL